MASSLESAALGAVVQQLIDSVGPDLATVMMAEIEQMPEDEAFARLIDVISRSGPLQSLTDTLTTHPETGGLAISRALPVEQLPLGSTQQGASAIEGDAPLGAADVTQGMQDPRFQQALQQNLQTATETLNPSAFTPENIAALLASPRPTVGMAPLPFPDPRFAAPSPDVLGEQVDLTGRLLALPNAEPRFVPPASPGDQKPVEDFLGLVSEPSRMLALPDSEPRFAGLPEPAPRLATGGPEDFLGLVPDPGRLVGLPFGEARFSGGQESSLLDSIIPTAQAIPAQPPAQSEVEPEFGLDERLPTFEGTAPSAPAALPSVAPPEQPATQIQVTPEVPAQAALGQEIDKLIAQSQQDAARGVNQEATISDYIDRVRQAQAEGLPVVPAFGNTGAPGEFQVSSASYGRLRRDQLAADAARGDIEMGQGLTPSERKLRAAEASHAASVESLAAAQQNFQGTAQPIREQLAQVDQAMASPELTPEGRRQAALVRRSLASQLQLAEDADKQTLNRIIKPLETQVKAEDQRLRLAIAERARNASEEELRQQLAGVDQGTFDAAKVAAGNINLTNEQVFLLMTQARIQERTVRVRQIRSKPLGENWPPNPARQAEEDLMWQDAWTLRQGGRLDAEQQSLANNVVQMKQLAYQSDEAAKSIQAALDQAQRRGETELSPEERASAAREGARKAFQEAVFQRGTIAVFEDNPEMMIAGGNQLQTDIVAEYRNLLAGPAVQPGMNALYQAVLAVAPEGTQQATLERMLQNFLGAYNTDNMKAVGLTMDANRLKTQAVDAGVGHRSRLAAQGQGLLTSGRIQPAPIPEPTRTVPAEPLFVFGPSGAVEEATVARGRLTPEEARQRLQTQIAER